MNFLYGAIFVLGAIIFNGIAVVLGTTNISLPIIHIHYGLSIITALIAVYYLFQAFFANSFRRS